MFDPRGVTMHLAISPPHPGTQHLAWKFIKKEIIIVIIKVPSAGFYTRTCTCTVLQQTAPVDAWFYCNKIFLFVFFF